MREISHDGFISAVEPIAQTKDYSQINPTNSIWKPLEQGSG